MVAPPLDYTLYWKDNRRRLRNLKFFVKIDKSMRAVTINSEFSLLRLMCILTSTRVNLDGSLQSVHSLNDRCRENQLLDKNLVTDSNEPEEML